MHAKRLTLTSLITFDDCWPKSDALSVTVIGIVTNSLVMSVSVV